MLYSNYLIPGLVFVTILMLSMSVYSYLGYRRKRRALVDKIRGDSSALSSHSAAEALPQERGFFGPVVNIAQNVGRKVRPEGEDQPSYMRQQFLRAGYRRRNAPVIFLGVKIILAGLLPLLFFAYRVVFILKFASVPVVGISVLLGLLGFYLPNLFLKFRIGKRKDHMSRGFPDALDLMVVCVEAGMGLDAAIQRVGEEMRLNHSVVADEFRVLSLELRAGKPRREALRNLAMRTGLEEVSSLMSLLIQTDKFGTSVTEALRVHADSMRVKRYQKAEELAAKIPVKLVFPLIIFIFPSFFLVLVGPAAIQMFRVLLPVLRGG